MWGMLLVCFVFLRGCGAKSIRDDSTIWELPLVSEPEQGQIVHVLNNLGMAGGGRPQYLLGISDIIVDPLAYEHDSIRRGDVVYFKTNRDNEHMEYDISRVIGLPGETIEIRKGQFYIDGRKLKAFYGSAFFGDPELRPKDAYTMEGKVTIPEGHYFLHGDLWWRTSMSGYISEGQVQGKVVAWMEIERPPVPKPTAEDFERFLQRYRFKPSK